MVGVGARSNESKGDRIKGGYLKLEAGEYARAVAVDQNRQQGRWMVCLGAPARVLAGQIGEVQAVYDFNDKSSQMVLGEPVVYRGR